MALTTAFYLEEVKISAHTPSVPVARMLVAPQLDAGVRDELVSDLERIPEPWLNFLDRYGLQVVTLQDGETLAQSPAMQKWAVPSEAAPVQQTLGAALGQLEAPPDPLQARLLRDQLADNIHGWLQSQDSPYRLALHERPVDPAGLAVQRKVPVEYRAQWQQELIELNAPWSHLEEGRLTSKFGLFLLPPIDTRWGAIPDARYQQALAVSGETVGASLGLNQGPEQLVLLHSRYLGGQAAEIGGYKLAVHEVGHALDYALEGLPAASGFGPAHKQKVRQLFESAREFTSDRADDSPREFFAEAVEAYLTEPSTGFDFRPDNHRARLEQTNPEMAAYLGEIFGTVPGADWVSQPPQAERLPEGTPDPDHDPIDLERGW